MLSNTDNAQLSFALIEVCHPGGFVIIFSKIAQNHNQTTLLFYKNLKLPLTSASKICNIWNSTTVFLPSLVVYPPKLAWLPWKMSSLSCSSMFRLFDTLSNTTSPMSRKSKKKSKNVHVIHQIIHNIESYYWTIG